VQLTHGQYFSEQRRHFTPAQGDQKGILNKDTLTSTAPTNILQFGHLNLITAQVEKTKHRRTGRIMTGLLSKTIKYPKKTTEKKYKAM